SGGAPGGAGGKGAGFVDTQCDLADPAAGGGTYGGGGGGANGNSSPAGIGGGGVCIITWNPVSGLDEVDANAPVLLCNPFSDRIGLRNAKGNEYYELLDATGRTTWKGAHIETQDFSALGSGAYFLKVSANGTLQTMRLVK
ncbi:MAG TPA: T9SS type A sorting domain-containing protein, partial [Flavobacteriales bacterium]|nr:T9SS type A sorting domain-containing protein [Flavobacteriales bacterium]